MLVWLIYSVSFKEVFEGDGTTDAAELVIADDNGNSLILEVRPLLDSVRIFDDEV